MNKKTFFVLTSVVLALIVILGAAAGCQLGRQRMALPGGVTNLSGLHIEAPTVSATGTPALMVDNYGLGAGIEIKDNGTAVFQVNSSGAMDSESSGDFANWVKVSAPTAIATATPAVVIDSAGVSALLEVRKAATPMLQVSGAGVLDVNGGIDLDGASFDVDITGGASIDADQASNFNAAAGDITFEAETGSVVVKGDEAAADAVHIDANDAAGSGVTIDVGASGGLNIGGGLTDIGGGTGGTADGDNDLLVAADLEIDGVLDVDGSVDVDGTGADIDVTGGVSIDADTASNLSTSAQDITIEAETGSVTVKGDEAAADAISLDADEAAGSGLTIAVGASGGVNIGGGLTDIGGGTGGTADGDNDLLVAADLEVDGILDVDGSVDVDGTGADIDVTGGVSIDADTASNLSTSAQDITIEAETGSVTVKGDEAASDAILLDADEAAGSGVTINVGATGGMNVSGGDVTVSSEATGGNAGAVNQIIGVPRIMNVGIGTMANGGTNTVLTDIGDSETPATDWTAIDADTVMSNDTTYFRQGTASLKMAVADTADDGDGCTNALASGDQDWTDDEAFGFWFYSDKALDAGDITLQIHDVTAVGGFTDVNLPAYATPNVWVWTELDVTLGNNNLKDVTTDLSFTLSAAGAAQAASGAFNVYFDFIVKWDVAEEESLGQSILQDGVLSVTVIDATDAGATSANLTLYTDYFVHYQSGNDAVVMITDQSDTDKVGLALIAY